LASKFLRKGLVFKSDLRLITGTGIVNVLVTYYYIQTIKIISPVYNHWVKLPTRVAGSEHCRCGDIPA
jgi:hypothetical protein